MTKTARRRTRANSATPQPPLHATPVAPKGSLLVIGGNENKDGHRPILEEIARRANGGKLIVATMASDEPDAQWREYQKVFRELGARRVEHLDVRRREELLEEPRTELVDGAKVVFFAGGDQLKITSRFGGTVLCDRVRELYEQGATIAGTSSGASVMSETMMVSGAGDESHGDSSGLRMAPGLALMPGVVIDQHFAERGRISRLIAAIAQNPRLLGIGVDEDTAVLFDGARRMTVLGSGAVYVVDGRAMTYTTASQEQETSSVFGMVIHVLSRGDSFDLESREPRAATRNGRGKAQRPRG